MKIIKSCDFCKIIFERNISQKTKNRNLKHNFCSDLCSQKWQSANGSFATLCSWCNAKVTRCKSQKSPTGRQFCNLSCSASYNNTLKRKTCQSKCEILLANLIKEEFPNLQIFQGDKTMLDGYEADIAIPSLNLAIEWNGIIHFKPIYGEQRLNEIKNRDIKKTNIASNKGVNLIVIPDLVSTPKYVKESFQHIKKIIYDRFNCKS